MPMKGFESSSRAAEGAEGLTRAKDPIAMAAIATVGLLGSQDFTQDFTQEFTQEFTR